MSGYLWTAAYLFCVTLNVLFDKVTTESGRILFLV